MGVTNSFKASSDIQMNLKPNTRFSATPVWRSTFVNYHMDEKSAGFISEQNRFRKTSNSLAIKNDFQQEDKMRKQNITENRVSRKRNIFNTFDQKAYNNDVNSDKLDTNKLIHKAAIVQNYERQCHSRVI